MTKKTYEDGITLGYKTGTQEGYNQAIRIVLQALGISTEEKEDEEQGEEEFLNKPKNKQ